MPENAEFRIIRSARRKHIVFRAGTDGVIEILAPLSVQESFLRQIFKQERTIIAKLKSSGKKLLPDFSDGAEFWLLGKKYPLHLTKRLCLFDNAFMIPDGSENEKRTALTGLYKELARIIIIRKVNDFAPLCKVLPDKININSATTRWGSCSGKKTLSFSWKLVQCPSHLIDYVAVHELCHLKEMNHSLHFWHEVSAVMPDYARHRTELNTFARTLPRW